MLLQKGLKGRLKILGDDLGLDFKKANNNFLEEFKKLIKIRNLIVHNEGLADSDFVILYGENKIKKGDSIKIESKYLTDSLALVYFIGCYVLQEMQLKTSGNSLKSEDFVIVNPMHRLLKNGQYRFLRSIYDYGLEVKMDGISRKMIIINYCIGLKKQNIDKKHIERVLNEEDWSVLSLDFEMALSVLKGDDNKFYDILEILIKNKEIGKHELQEWELFSFYKKKTRFKALQKKVLK